MMAREMSNKQSQFSVYFAGKVRFGGGYRGAIFDRDVMGMPAPGCEPRTTCGDVLVTYCGPHAIDGWHGSSHGPATHGNSEFSSESQCRGEITKRCCDQIAAADGIAVYIETLDCYGTLVEIGYAAALDKPTVVCISPRVNALAAVPQIPDVGTDIPMIRAVTELWFVQSFPGVVSLIGDHWSILPTLIPLMQARRDALALPSDVPPSANPVPGFVYILDSDKGSYKIGRSMDPEGRVGNLGVVLPFIVRPIHIIASKDYVWLEKTLHKRFARSRTRGEWFNLTSEDIAWLKAVRRADPPSCRK